MSPLPPDRDDRAPVDPADFDVNQLNALYGFMRAAALCEVDGELVARFWECIRDDPDARAWLEDRARELDDVLQRQVDVLDAADLAVAGGHRPAVDHDYQEAEDRQWQVYCDCSGDELGAFPLQELAEQALEEHLRDVRGRPSAG